MESRIKPVRRHISNIVKELGFDIHCLLHNANSDVLKVNPLFHYDKCPDIKPTMQTTPLLTGGQVQTSTALIPRPAPTEVDTNEHRGISTAAKAGIGAGAGAGAPLITVIVFLLLKIRNDKKTPRAPQEGHRWPGMYQETTRDKVSYNNNLLEGETLPQNTVSKAPPVIYGNHEMDAGFPERHWKRVELPANP